ncbi:MAG: SDR family NAD(P)-dependent oxidoreductase [Acidimicrobiia bacterium]
MTSPTITGVRAWEVPVPHARAWVTGAGSGIGRAAALSLSALGVVVYASGRRTHLLESLAEEASIFDGTIISVECDITDPTSVGLAFDRVGDGGPVTALVHAAAQMQLMEARSMSPAQFAEVVGSTLLGTFNVVHRWATPLLDGGIGGSAVALTSCFASKGTPGISHSSSGKAGVEALVKSLAREWGPHGITLNAVGPGSFPVEKSIKLWQRPDMEARMRDEIALGRYGELAEIVGPIMFLLSSAGAYTTGQSLVVDGGLSLSHWPVPRDDIRAGFNNQYLG